MSPRYQLQRTALVDEVVVSTKMALQMPSQIQSLQTVHQRSNSRVLWPLTVNNQPVRTFPTPTLVHINVLNV